MKRAKNLVIMAAVLAVLAGVYLVVGNIVKQSEESGDDTTEEGYAVTALDASTLSSMKVKITASDDSGTTITELSFSLSEDETKWLWADDESVPLDNTAFANIVTAINDSVSPVKLENVTDEEMADYGLASPAIEVTFGFSDGTGYTAKLGDYNSFKGMYYYMDSNDPDTVYMVDSTVEDYLDVSIFDLLAYDELPEISSAKITSLTYTKGDRELVFTYYATGNSDDYTDAYNWYLSVNGAEEFAISASLGDDITSAITSRTLLDAVAYNTSNDAEYGMDAPGKLVISYMRTDTITDSTTGSETEITTPATYTLYFGDTDEDAYYYVRTQDSNLIYTISYSDEFFDMFEEEGRNLRPTELVNLNDTYLDGVVYTAGTSVLEVKLTHADGTTAYTLANGETLDFDKYSEIAETLAGITATSYTSVLEADSSVGNDLIFSAKYSFNSGSRSEGTLEIRKYSQSYAVVSFMGRDDQLITMDEANSLAALVAAY